MPPEKSALLVVDIQNDFLPGGSLAVPDGDAIIPVVNRIMHQVEFDCGIYLSKDWHPSDHVSFASSHPGKTAFESTTLYNGYKHPVEQVLWPDHCVQHSYGSRFASQLTIPDGKSTCVVKKGMNRLYDSYSAFYDNAKIEETMLREELKKNEVETLYVCGLALDYCVLFSVLDAIELGFNLVLIEDATVSLATMLISLTFIFPSVILTACLMPY